MLVEHNPDVRKVVVVYGDKQVAELCRRITLRGGNDIAAVSSEVDNIGRVLKDFAETDVDADTFILDAGMGVSAIEQVRERFPRAGIICLDAGSGIEFPIEHRVIPMGDFSSVTLLTAIAES